MRPSDAALDVAVLSVSMQDRKIQINLLPVSATTREKLSQPGKAMLVIPTRVTLSSVDKNRNVQVVLPQVPRSTLEELAKWQEAKLLIKL